MSTTSTLFDVEVDVCHHPCPPLGLEKPHATVCCAVVAREPEVRRHPSPTARDEFHSIPRFGGRFVPEALFERLDELRVAFEATVADPAFWSEFHSYYALFGGPSRLHLAKHLTEIVRGPRIYLKREDLKYTGSHAVGNALGQALFARRLGKKRVVAETGSGSHGVATAAVCQLLGLECVVYMGAEDARRHTGQKLRMEMLGARVVEVSTGGGTLREATNEALRAIVTDSEDVYLLNGGPNGSEPVPSMVGVFQQFVGVEIHEQMQKIAERRPHTVIACAGAHGPATGVFSAFDQDLDVNLVAVEGGGRGVDGKYHAAVLSRGTPGVFRGAHTLLLQDDEGQVLPCFSVAADFRDPSAAPQLAEWVISGRATAVAITDDGALFGRSLLKLTENIDCSLEDGHAIGAALTMAQDLPKNADVVICIGSGTADQRHASAFLDLL